MKPAAALRKLGGIAPRDQLRALTHWRQIDAALEEHPIVRGAHGQYPLPVAEQGRIEALRLSGIASHATAANPFESVSPVVLRFSWEQVMFEPEWVASVIRRAVQRRLARGTPAWHTP